MLSSDPVVEATRLFAVALRHCLGEATIREAAELTGVSYSVVASILRGDSWPDSQTVARLETALGYALWPRWVEGRGYVPPASPDDQSDS